MAVSCCQSQEIPRVSALSPAQFHAEYFLRARPVIITDAAEDWPARSWTIPGLVDRVGDNEVWVRGKTNQEDYRVGKVGHTVLEILKSSNYLYTSTLSRHTPSVGTRSGATARICSGATRGRGRATWRWPRCSRPSRSCWRRCRCPPTCGTTASSTSAPTSGSRSGATTSSATSTPTITSSS